MKEAHTKTDGVDRSLRIACPPRSRFDAPMPDDPFVREKFTKERSAAQEGDKGIFQAIPQGAIPDRGRKLTPSPIAKLRVHDEAAAPAHRWLIVAGGNEGLTNRYRCRAVASLSPSRCRQIHNQAAEGQP